LQIRIFGKSFKSIRFLLYILSYIISKLSRAFNLNKPLTNYKNILVIRADFLGDSVLNTALISALKISFPNARISLIGAKGVVSNFENDTNIAEVIGINDPLKFADGLNRMMKVISVVGARPQFIKLAPLFPRLQEQFDATIIHTGQHYDDPMSTIFFRDLSIPQPDYNLNIGSGRHGVQTGNMLKGLEEVFIYEKPDWVLVFGDTNTTLAGALAASKLKIKLAHIEAGLRSYVKTMPEEINRVVADRLSDILYCPTQTAVDNLKKEGITDGVHLVGDLMYEALELYDETIERKSVIMDELSLKTKDYILLTIHRAENTDDHQRLRNLINEIIELPYKIVFPAHPRTRKELKSAGLWKRLEDRGNIILLEPVSYIDNIKLIKYAFRVLTDSGGMQKEAYYYGVPTITLRDETEWPETVKAGGNKLLSKSNNVRELINDDSGGEGGGPITPVSCSVKIQRILRGI